MTGLGHETAGLSGPGFCALCCCELGVHLWPNLLNCLQLEWPSFAYVSTLFLLTGQLAEIAGQLVPSLAYTMCMLSYMIIFCSHTVVPFCCHHDHLRRNSGAFLVITNQLSQSQSTGDLSLLSGLDCKTPYVCFPCRGSHRLHIWGGSPLVSACWYYMVGPLRHVGKG